jgi:tRNA threonylcarbamoyladenosine biosynthesis protein TsaE
MKTITLQSNSSEDTIKLGQRLGALLRGGEVIELASDLGGGKTTIVRGIAKGFGSTDVVSSPSFTISKVYKTGKRQIVHFDFYRLQEADLIEHELADFLGDPDSVLLIEWAGAVAHILPESRIKLEIKKTGIESRDFCVTVPEEYAYIEGAFE